MLFLRILVCLLLAGFGRGNSPAQEPFDPAGYRHSARLVVVGLDGDEVLTDFPLLVKFSTNLPGFRYSQVRSPTAADLRFVDEWGNEWPSQIEVWNPAGDSWVWVRTPVLSNGLTLRAWWGADGVSEPAYRHDGTTFAGPGFAAVWHMETNYIRDATGNGYHAQRIPVPAAVQTVPGVVGPAQRFNGRVGNNNRIVVGPALRVPAAFTVSAWGWLEDETRDGVILAKLGRMFFVATGRHFPVRHRPVGRGQAVSDQFGRGTATLDPPGCRAERPAGGTLCGRLARGHVAEELAVGHGQRGILRRRGLGPALPWDSG